MRLFCPTFSRCYDPGTMLALAVVGGGMSIAGGVGQMQAANKEAAFQQEQGAIALKESQVNADNAAFNLTQQVQNQRLAFLANGVSLEGSPTAVLAASKAYGQTQVNSILNQGAAQYNLAQKQAANTKNAGRAALIGGIASAITNVAGAGSKAYQSGLFDNSGWSFANTGMGPSNTAPYTPPRF